ncbi:hypothetical protein [Commensalibacter communis]|uniref:hypothetical protein n=1 Tax=Commensalibacter communis TaxID=2972786 RepID=UPI0022FF5AFF|nr:hypothetical protein [Commensalibacter communis]CAI3933671.1 unnamed protein product [Commensalibacter communis]CAI3944544.1 unnamed protein product [Commensalibacter communis]
MGKAKRKAQPRYPKIVQEHGLQEQWRSGRLEVVEGQDGENPKRTVERLRVKSVYDEMLSRGTITKEQRDCAEKYAILCERALGATQDLYAKVSLLSSSRNKWEPTQAQSDAYGKWFIIKSSMGVYLLKILNMLVLANMSGTQISVCEKVSKQHAIGLISASLTRLEEIMQDY